MIKALSVAAACVMASVAAAQAPLDELLKDVKTVAGPGSPGVVLSLTETVWPIVAGGLDKGTMGPVIVAGTWGKGRIVAMGHSGYIDKDNFKVGETELLMDRLVKWAASGAVVPANGAPLHAVVVDGDVGPWLSARGFTVAKGDAAALLTRDNLEKAHTTLVVIGGRDLTAEQSAALTEYVKAGGGLVAAQTGWGWQQIKGGPDMRTNSLNKLLLDAGVAWTDEIIDETGKGGDGFDATKRINGPWTLKAAVGELLVSDGQEPLKDKEAEKVRKDKLNQASAIVSRGIRVLPETDKTTRPRLAELMASHEKDLVPTEKTPLDGKKPLLRTLMALQMDAINAAPVEKIKAHPAAATFPGAVPPPSEAPRVKREVEIDAAVQRWHSLGLYAPAGEVITVVVPPRKTGRAEPELSVRIGCHTDKLWHLPSWKRVPEISRSWRLKEGENKIASAFGGLVYIDVEKSGRKDATPLKVTIGGCVEAPLFVLGVTDVQEWKKTIRNAPGPWAELAMPSVIISVPSSAVRELEDPTELCVTWQKVLDHAADLGAIDRKRPSPERYVPDIQISAGYMHSGYPIMTHMDAVDDMSQAGGAKLKAGSWGLFHELGHNHQKGEWTFGGTGEVTCNLWSLYLMETISGKKGGGAGLGHDAMDSETKRREKALRHIQTGADFEKWKSDPFLALEMYYELREAFGWEPFTKVFAEYQKLKPSEKPQTDPQKHDEWMVRMSRAVGKNLGPFFQKWGVPTSEKARKSIEDLPAWMPEWLQAPVGGPAKVN